MWKQARQTEILRNSKALRDGSSTEQPDFSHMPSPLLVAIVGGFSSLSAYVSFDAILSLSSSLAILSPHLPSLLWELVLTSSTTTLRVRH